MNFREWLLNEMPHYVASKIESLNGEPFFYFDNKPVVGIDFRFERIGYARLCSGKNVRWYTPVPSEVKYADGQIVPITPSVGRYIVVNSYCEPINIALSNAPQVAARHQLKMEMRQKINKSRQHISPQELETLVNQELGTIKSIGDLDPEAGYRYSYYTVAPSAWIKNAVLEVIPTHDRTPHGVFDSSTGREIIELDKLTSKQVAVA